MLRVLQDNVFTAVRAAKEAQKQYGDAVTNATVGAFFDEEENLVAYNSVFDVFKELPSTVHSAYASDIQGNPDFREAVKEWLGFDEYDEVPHVIATPGGSGAIKTALHISMDAGQKALIPDIFWGPYLIMAQDTDLNVAKYPMFDGDHFAVSDFIAETTKLMLEQEKLVILMNDPAQNPTGYSMTDEEWAEVLAHLNELADKGRITLVLDVAYIDYTKQRITKHYFEKFKQLNKNITVMIAFSLSKTFTAYGVRVGALVIFGNEKDLMKDYAVYTARSTWSNVNNAGQTMFAKIVSNDHLLKAYNRERDFYVDILKRRSDIFLKEAKEVGLDIYPHVEGYFVTVKIDPELRETFEKQIRAKNVFGISLAMGYRIALCSMPVRKVYGLAKTLKETYDEVKG